VYFAISYFCKNYHLEEDPAQKVLDTPQPVFCVTQQQQQELLLSWQQCLRQLFLSALNQAFLKWPVFCSLFWRKFLFPNLLQPVMLTLDSHCGHSLIFLSFL
jgi:hypothetical protein